MLYEEYPASRGFLKSAGGPKAVCGRHSAMVVFLADSGAGSIGLAAKGDRERVSSSQKGDATEAQITEWLCPLSPLTAHPCCGLLHLSGDMLDTIADLLSVGSIHNSFFALARSNMPLMELLRPRMTLLPQNRMVAVTTQLPQLALLQVSLCGSVCHCSSQTFWANGRAVLGSCHEGVSYFEMTIVHSILIERQGRSQQDILCAQMNELSFRRQNQGLRPGIARVGWSTCAYGELGADSFGFGYGGTGWKSHCGEFHRYGSKYSTGDVIGCLLANGEVSFFKNGNSLGLAFVVPANLRGEVLFPAVSVKGCTVKVNLNIKQFAYPGWHASLVAQGTPHEKGAAKHNASTTKGKGRGKGAEGHRKVKGDGGKGKAKGGKRKGKGKGKGKGKVTGKGNSKV